MISAPCGHDVMLDMSGELAELLEALAELLEAGA
jgi:hypothetical protein